MTSTNTHYNPIFRATRAAFVELTTAEALRWYGQQFQNGAEISYQGFRMVQRWILSSREQAALIDQRQAITLPEVPAPAQANAPGAWLALEANSEVVNEPVQVDDTTELRPWTISVAIENIEDSTTQSSQAEPESGSTFNVDSVEDDESHALTTIEQVESEDADLADFEYLSSRLETASDSEVDLGEEDVSEHGDNEPIYSVSQAYSLD